MFTDLNCVVQPCQLLVGVAGVLVPQSRLLQGGNPKQLLHYCLDLLSGVGLAELLLLLLLQVGIFRKLKLNVVHLDLGRISSDQRLQ